MGTSKIRYSLIDNVRGLAVISMIVYHAIWSLVYLYNVNINLFESSIAYMWQQSTSWIFIFLSGFSYNMSKNKVKNALKVFSIGLLVTLITTFLMPENKIVFGVLTLIGSSMLIVLISERVLKKIDSKLGAIIAVTIFIITRNINAGYLGFEKVNLYSIPPQFYINTFTSYIGFTSTSFKSSDYFSLFPCFFLFLAGYYFNIYVFQYGLQKYLVMKDIPVLSWFGKRSLTIYVLHQPIILIIMYFLNLLI